MKIMLWPALLIFYVFPQILLGNPAVQEITLLKMAEQDAQALKEGESSPGLHLYSGQRLRIYLEETPPLTQISEEGAGEIDTYVKLLGMPQANGDQHHFEINIVKDNQKFRLHWSDDLVAKYEAARNVNGVHYYVEVNTGFLNDFSKVHSLVVGSFGYTFDKGLRKDRVALKTNLDFLVDEAKSLKMQSQQRYVFRDSYILSLPFPSVPQLLSPSSRKALDIFAMMAPLLPEYTELFAFETYIEHKSQKIRLLWNISIYPHIVQFSSRNPPDTIEAQVLSGVLDEEGVLTLAVVNANFQCQSNQCKVLNAQ